MNIFAVHRNPTLAARALHDAHVNKMTLESAQMLSTAHRVLDGEKMNVMVRDKNGNTKMQSTWVLPVDKFIDGIFTPQVYYKAAHVNHPDSIWCRQSTANYRWLYEHFSALASEHYFRTGNWHGSWTKLGKVLLNMPDNIAVMPLTPQPLCMDEEYKCDDVTISYRSFYNGKKLINRAGKVMTWTRRNKPEWVHGTGT